MCHRVLTRAIVGDDTSYWVGLYVKESGRKWEWVNGRQATEDDRTLWQENEPNDKAGVEDCAGTYEPNWFLLNDYKCAFGMVAVCEKLI